MSDEKLQGTPPAVRRIADFAVHTKSAALTPEIRRSFKRNILDSLACAIGALYGPPFAIFREQFSEYRSPGKCTLIGGGKTSIDQAAFFNSGLVRYVDLLDSYMAPGGLCHPSDNFGAVLAAAEDADATGEDFMLALAVAYEIQCRITAAVPVMAKGFNHATQLAISSAAGAGRLLGLNAQQIANAIGIASADNVSLACVHAEPVSQWKGFSPGMTVMRSMYAVSLAKRGLEGPSGLFEGPNGLEKMFGQVIDIDWSNTSLGMIGDTVFKKYCCLIHGQPVLEAVLSLRREHNIRASEVGDVVCDIFQSGYDFAGGGVFGAKDHPQTKEQADYNLKYLISAALLDGQVGPPQLDPERIQSADIQTFLSRVIIQPNETFSKRYPRELDARITIRTSKGDSLVKNQFGYEGGLGMQLSWSRVVEKFHWLTEVYASAELRGRIIETVENLENRSIADLMVLLSNVESSAAFKATHPGIQ